MSHYTTLKKDWQLKMACVKLWPFGRLQNVSAKTAQPFPEKLKSMPLSKNPVKELPATIPAHIARIARKTMFAKAIAGGSRLNTASCAADVMIFVRILRNKPVSSA